MFLQIRVELQTATHEGATRDDLQEARSKLHMGNSRHRGAAEVQCLAIEFLGPEVDLCTPPHSIFRAEPDGWSIPSARIHDIHPQLVWEDILNQLGNEVLENVNVCIPIPHDIPGYSSLRTSFGTNRQTTSVMVYHWKRGDGRKPVILPSIESLANIGQSESQPAQCDLRRNIFDMTDTRARALHYEHTEGSVLPGAGAISYARAVADRHVQHEDPPPPPLTPLRQAVATTSIEERLRLLDEENTRLRQLTATLPLRGRHHPSTADTGTVASLDRGNGGVNDVIRDVHSNTDVMNVDNNMNSIAYKPYMHTSVTCVISNL